jgi:hypothetical protein
MKKLISNMKNILLFFFIFSISFCYSETLKNRLEKAQSGDFFVLKQKKILTILRIAKITTDKLIIEEISAPITAISNTNWQNWIKNYAPGNTSWIMFEIDLNNSELVEIFSFTRMAWLESSKNDNFLVQMLTNDFKKLSNKNRKKIGAPPLRDELDRRAVWNPPMKINNQKISNPSYDVYQTFWKEDSSELSGKEIQLYFDKKREFFFPFWIELIGDHLSFSLKVIDAGHQLLSPKNDIPYRPLEFFLKPKISNEGLSFFLISPKYYKEFEVLALNYLDEDKNFKKLSYYKKTIQNDKIELFIDKKTLKNHLQDNTYYTWFIKPLNSKTVLEWRNPLFNK